MKVFKFGGASIKDANSVKNVAEIISGYPENLIVVISAMGKTTNALEAVYQNYIQGESASTELEEVLDFHQDIIRELALNLDDSFMALYHNVVSKLKSKLSDDPTDNEGYEYDQIVSTGEILSTTIVSGYLNSIGKENLWLDARKIIRTTGEFRAANIDWELTDALFKAKVNTYFNHSDSPKLAIIQGFIGHNDTGQATTLGREGSDFSGAIVAWCNEAEELIIWKDVPGMLNADPKYFTNTEKLDEISYKEALELSYYGASVIHPKTIKPLQNKNIPLFVKSFENPQLEGTKIYKDATYDGNIPSYIYKEKQTLVTIEPKDFSFIAEGNLSEIYQHLKELNVKVNLMQNSALSFSICIDEDDQKLKALIAVLQENYLVKYNTGLDLLTVRHYKEDVTQQLLKDKIIYVEQKSRQTARFIIK